MDGKSKISVVLNESEFARFDAYCAQKGFKKSTLIARLIREYLEHENFQQQSQPTRRGAARGRAAPRAGKRTRS